MTTASSMLRSRYVGDSVATASPQRLVVLLYERLVLDLVRAEDALRAGDAGTGRAQLQHAQDIVLELRGGLDTSAWDGGPGLAALYGYVFGELSRAHVDRDPDRAATCRTLVEPLRDAWRTAAGGAAS